MPDLSIIFDMGVVALRFLMPVYAIIIVYQCFAAMRRRRRPETPLISLLNPATGEILPVLFWENSIGRSRASDIVVDDPAVSRNHCVLLRRASGWYICDTGSKGGTYVNGEEAVGRTRVLIDDVISVGNSQFQFLRGEDYDENLRYSWFFKKANNKPAMKSWKKEMDMKTAALKMWNPAWSMIKKSQYLKGLEDKKEKQGEAERQKRMEDRYGKR